MTAEIWEIETTSEIDQKWVGGWFGHYEYSSNHQWKDYADTYTVPEGQYATRFFFAAGDTATGDVTVGNLIDNVWFSSELPPAQPNKGHLTVTKTVTGVGRDAVMDNYYVKISINDGEFTGTINHFEYNVFTGNWVGSVSFQNLSLGNYTATETEFGAIPGYEAAASGNTISDIVQVENGKTATANLINAYEATTYNLKVEKKLSHAAPEEANSAIYEFTIQGPDTVKGEIYYTGLTNDGVVDMDSMQVAFDSTTGKATIAITGENNMTIYGLPEGTYTVTETAGTVGNYAYESQTDSVTLGTDLVSEDGAPTGTVTITNSFTLLTGDLKVTKFCYRQAGDWVLRHVQGVFRYGY